MVELHRTSLFHARLCSRSIQAATRGRSLRVSRRITQSCNCVSKLRYPSLLLMMSCSSLLSFVGGMSLSICRSTALILGTEDSFWAFNTMLRLLLPGSCTLGAVVRATSSLSQRLAATYCLNHSSHRSCHSNSIWVAPCSTLYSISGREEGIEALNEVWMTSKEVGNAADDTRCVNASCSQLSHQF
jgi:hypothetical protein